MYIIEGRFYIYSVNIQVNEPVSYLFVTSFPSIYLVIYISLSIYLATSLSIHIYLSKYKILWITKTNIFYVFYAAFIEMGQRHATPSSTSMTNLRSGDRKVSIFDVD